MLRASVRSKGELGICLSLLTVVVILSVKHGKLRTTIMRAKTLLQVHIIDFKEMIEGILVDMVLGAKSDRNLLILWLYELGLNTDVSQVDLTVFVSARWLIFVVPFTPRLKVILRIGSFI